MGLSLSYVMAGYNEGDLVTESVVECIRVLERDFDDFEVILVDDGSKDNTAQLMDELAAQYPCVKVLKNIVNLNFGAATLRGLNYAKKDIVIFNAMDLPLEPGLIKQIASEMGDADMMVLERIDYKATRWRRVTSFINSLMLRILFPRAIIGTPVLNYVQVFKRETVSKVLPLARSPIFVWPEMIFRAKYLGLNVVNRKTPVQVKDVRKGAFGKPHDIIWGIYDMLRFRIRKWGNSI